MKNLFTYWYNEFGGPSEITKEDFFLKASGVEIFLFYLTLVLILLFCLICYFSENISWKHFLLLAPLPIWAFLRSSRKDMSATANWIAGIFGAIGGAAIVIAIKILLK